MVFGSIIMCLKIVQWYLVNRQFICDPRRAGQKKNISISVFIFPRNFVLAFGPANPLENRIANSVSSCQVQKSNIILLFCCCSTKKKKGGKKWLFLFNACTVCIIIISYLWNLSVFFVLQTFAESDIVCAQHPHQQYSALVTYHFDLIWLLTTHYTQYIWVYVLCANFPFFVIFFFIFFPYVSQFAHHDHIYIYIHIQAHRAFHLRMRLPMRPKDELSYLNEFRRSVCRVGPIAHK